jgi:hypothetical protein
LTEAAGVTGSFCTCLLERLMTVKVWLWTTPVAIANLLMISRLNRG